MLPNDRRKIAVKLKNEAWTIPRAREATLAAGQDFSRSVLRSSEILLQNCATLRNAPRKRNCELPSISNDMQSSETLRNSLGLNYKSAALPAELWRRLRGKILSDAAPANLFLYAFSIRQLLTPLKASFWNRPEHTGRNSHRFGASAMTHRLRAWSRDCICLSNAQRMGGRV